MTLGEFKKYINELPDDLIVAKIEKHQTFDDWYGSSVITKITPATNINYKTNSDNKLIAFEYE